MREITGHKVNECNENLEILAIDEPGSGGANHSYSLSWKKIFDKPENATEATLNSNLVIDFQNGPIAEAGTNGVTHEALIAIVIDRLRAFQAGPYACRENALALTKLEEAQHWLHHRTRERAVRGVEGTHAK